MPFPNADIFLSYKNKWQDIQVVSEAEVNIYPNVQYIKLVNGKKIYWLQNNVKRLIDDKQVKLLDIPDQQVIVVNKKEFDFYKTGKVVASDEIEIDKKNISEIENKCTPDSQAGGDEGCKIFTALETKDLKTCYEITNEVWRAKCFESVSAVDETALNGCEALTTVELKNECFSQIALVTQNKTLCEKLKDKNQKDFCESKIAIKQKQSTACEQLIGGDSEVGKNYCWFIYGTINNSLTACEKIDSQSKYKNACKEIISAKTAYTEYYKPKTVSILASLLKIKSAEAQSVLTGAIPVGGKFLAGAFDIYTPTPIPPCMLVTVVGPNPGVFNFFPTFIYDYFIEAPTHINLNMLGVARILPPCPPTLYVVGSGLRPESY
jgi:hypothetical protein